MSAPAVAADGGGSSGSSRSSGSGEPQDHGRPLLGGAAEPAVEPRRTGPRPEGRSSQVLGRRHFSALLAKNALVKRREWSATCCPFCPLGACCELVLPLAVLALLAWAKSECASGGQCKLPVLAGWGGHMPKEEYATECAAGLPMLDAYGELLGYSSCSPWTEHFRRPRAFLDVLAYLHWSNKSLALAAEDPADIPKVERLRSWISTHWYPDQKLADIPCVELEVDWLASLQRSRGHGHSPPVHRFPCRGGRKNPGILPNFTALTHPRIFTSAELDTYLDSGSYGSDGLLYGAVVFSALGEDGGLGSPGRWAYSIRLNVSAETTCFTARPGVRPLELGLREGEAAQYLGKGFVAVQLMLDRYIIGRRSVAAAENATLLLEANNLLPEELDLLQLLQNKHIIHTTA